MYTDIKSNALSEKEAIKIVGEENVEEVKSLNCDFTGRVIDDVFNVVELSSSIKCKDLEGDDCILTILYLVSKDEEDEDMGNWDYSNYTFEII